MRYLPRSPPGTSRPRRAGWAHACATADCSHTASPAAGGRAGRQAGRRAGSGEIGGGAVAFGSERAMQLFRPAQSTLAAAL